MLVRLQDHPNIPFGPDGRNQLRAGGRNIASKWSILTRPGGRPSRVGHRQRKRQLEVSLFSSRKQQHRAQKAKLEAYAMAMVSLSGHV